jgi:hypothetical protein
MATALKEATVTLTAAQAAVVANALADAEQYRRDPAVAWCADCAATQEGPCPDHLANVAPANAYRELAAELAHVTNAAGHGVCPPRPASEPLPRNRERTHQ